METTATVTIIVTRVAEATTKVIAKGENFHVVS